MYVHIFNKCINIKTICHTLFIKTFERQNNHQKGVNPIRAFDQMS